MFNGKTALVTGAGSGMGEATARRLAQEGAAVGVVDIDPEAARQTVDRIRSEGGKAIAVIGDISREDDNARMFDETAAAFGPVDAAFLNAAILPPPFNLEEVTLDLWDKVMNVNLRGTFIGVKAGLLNLRKGGACVVNASTAGVRGYAEEAAYSTSKHGLIGLVRSAAYAYSQRGLRINAVLPGYVLTPMNKEAREQPILPPSDLPNVAYREPMLPQHVAEMVLFLLGSRSGGINGAAHTVDTGLTAMFPPLQS